MQHGLSPSTPVALIENGTTDRERRIVGTLAIIERQAMRAQLDPAHPLYDRRGGRSPCPVTENFTLSRESDSDTLLHNYNRAGQGRCGAL
jgi:Uroporphyrinogen-III methylase